MSALEFSGVEQTFTCLAGEAKVFEWVFMRGGERLDIGDVVFTGHVLDADERVVGEIGLEHESAATGVLRVYFPVLEEGTFEYEVRYQSELGSVGRIAFGRIGVVSSRLILEELEGSERDATQLVLNLPERAGGQIQLEWRASSAALAAAQQAIEAAQKLVGVDATLDRLEAQVDEFRVFTVRWKEEVQNVLVMNPITGTIWVGDFDTGRPYRGEDGRAPRVNAYGFWETYDGKQWNTLPYKASGRDGIDGDQVRRYMLQSEDELPEAAERGVVYYTPRAGGGHNLWAWVEDVGWQNIGTDAYGYAEAEYMGMVKLATDEPVRAGGPVGLNEAKQAMVPLATSSVPGVVQVTSEESDVGGGTHVNAEGRLLTDVADVGTYGSVKLSSSALLVDEAGNNFGGLVGRNRDGQLMVQVATAGQVGAVKPGSGYDQFLDPPFQVAVGVDKHGALANCLLKGGALQHRTPSDWQGRENISWLESGAFPGDGAHYLGLNTSTQFRQSREDGLELLMATESRVAGVRFSRGPEDDESAGTVLPADVAARKDEVLSVEVAAARFMTTEGGCMTVKVCTSGELPKAKEQEKGVLYIVR